MITYFAPGRHTEQRHFFGDEHEVQPDELTLERMNSFNFSSSQRLAHILNGTISSIRFGNNSDTLPAKEDGKDSIERKNVIISLYPISGEIQEAGKEFPKGAKSQERGIGWTIAFDKYPEEDYLYVRALANLLNGAISEELREQSQRLEQEVFAEPRYCGYT